MLLLLEKKRRKENQKHSERWQEILVKRQALIQESELATLRQLRRVAELIKTENNSRISFVPATVKQTQPQIPTLLNKSQK